MIDKLGSQFGLIYKLYCEDYKGFGIQFNGVIFYQKEVIFISYNTAMVKLVLL